MKTRNKAAAASRQTMNGMQAMQQVREDPSPSSRENGAENIPPSRGAAIKKDTVGKAGGQPAGAGEEDGTVVVVGVAFFLSFLSFFFFLQIVGARTW